MFAVSWGAPRTPPKQGILIFVSKSFCSGAKHLAGHLGKQAQDPSDKRLQAWREYLIETFVQFLPMRSERNFLIVGIQ